MYENELAQMQAVFDAAEVGAKKADGEVKKVYEPAFKAGEKAQAIITGSRIGGPPWPGDDRIFLSIDLTHPISDRTEQMWLPLTNLTEKAAGWVKSQLKAIDYDLDETPISEIERHNDAWIGLTVEIFAKKNARGKMQYYLNHIIKDEASEFDTKVEDDDIPF